MSDLLVIWTIARKDLQQEFRSRASTIATLFFSSIVIVILAFALGPGQEALRTAATGALWVALAFAGTLSAAQSYQNELEEGAFEQLVLYPIPRVGIYLGKLLANWLIMALLGTILMPVTFVLFNASASANILLLLLTIALGTLGFALIATFYAALTANLRARESLLPILMFPIVAPVLLAAVNASKEIVRLGNIELALSWLQLLLAFDLVYLVVCSFMFSFVVEDG
jgi:heme exporter protein B